MEGKGLKKKSYFSVNTIMKVYLPIVLTIFIVFNIPFIPNPIGLNTNLNFQPAAASGEAYFFDEAYFKQPNKNKKSNIINNNNNNRDLNIAIWIAFLIICIIFGFIYFIFNGVKSDNEQEKQNSQNKIDYIELLKDDSDFEGNI